MRRSVAESVAFTARTTAAARQNLTPAHRALWEALRARNSDWRCEFNATATTKNGGEYPERFDLYHLHARLAVECDGGYHKRTRGNDRRRDMRFATAGISTLRYSNARVLTDLAAVVAEIEAVINVRNESRA
jgi:very-short-patch-repair endonuclease